MQNALLSSLIMMFPGRSFSFASARIRQALDRREGLVIVTGKSGTGKTALCRFVLQQLALPNLVSVITDPFLGADELLKHVLRDFGASSDEKLDAPAPGRTTSHHLVVRLDRFLRSRMPAVTAVLVIEDAQHLQRCVFEQIRALSNLESDEGKLLQIVLIGEPELDAALRRPEAYQLDQRVACRVCLEPLSRAEVRRYIEHRLTADRSGGKAGAVHAGFSASAGRTLATVSGGIPRVLNALCNRVFEIGVERRTDRVTRRIVLEAARQLKLPIPVTTRYPVVRDLAGATLLLTLSAASSIWLARLLPRPGLAGVAERTPAAPSRVIPTATSLPIAKLEPTAVKGTLQAADSYLVVVASFRSAHNASAIAARLDEIGLPAFTRDDEPGGWYVVLVGPYASMDEAREAQKQVASHNFPDSRTRVQRR